MKKFLPLLLVLVAIGQGYAQTSQLLISENFTGYANTNLNTTSNGQGGTYRWTASSYFSSDYVQVANSTAIFYPGYTSGTQYVNLTSRDDEFFQYPDDPSKRFNGNTNVSLSSATTFYMSFVVRVPSQTGVTSTGSATQTVALQTSGGDNVANFYIGKNSSNQLKFGIDKNGGSDGDYSSSVTYSYNTPYLIVIRYDVVNSGSSNDKMYLWVNPSLSAEPTIASAAVTVTTGSDVSGNVNALQLFQDDNSATASFDGFKVSYGTGSVSNNSIIAWDALSPIGAPLPVKFGDIKGYSKDKGIQLDWNVYSEFNVIRYEIERSSDGVSFSYAGSVPAKKEEGELFYGWFDATPLAGNNYYRIKNVDIDGKSAYSSVVKVSVGKLSAGIAIFPNPVINDHISLQAADVQKGDYKIEIFSTAGQQVYKKQFNHAGGAINQSLQLPSALQGGIYTIQLAGNGVKLAKSFLIQ